MKRVFWIMIVAIAAAAASAEVIDRIVAIVNRTPILASDWDEELRFESFADGRTAEPTAAEREAALERLIDQALIAQQMTTAKYVPAPEAEIDASIEQVKAQIAKDGGEWARKLRGYGLSEMAVRRHIRKQVDQLRFIELRFAREAQPKPDAVERYYANDYLPKVRAAGGAEKPLAEVQDQIGQILAEQRIDQLLTTWLQALRSQAQITKRGGDAAASAAGLD